MFDLWTLGYSTDFTSLKDKNTSFPAALFIVSSSELHSKARRLYHVLKIDTTDTDNWLYLRLLPGPFSQVQGSQRYKIHT